MGEKPALSRLQVKRIRALYCWRAKGHTLVAIAKEFKVSTSTVFKAVNRITPYDGRLYKKEE